MNTEISRSTHPTAAQLDCLVEFLEANRDLAKGFSKNPSARARSNLKWEQLASKLNSMGGSLKNFKKWMKYWADKKCAVKKKAAARNAARRRTGGGCEEVAELTEVEERILAIMGGESFATGDSHLRFQLIDPPQTQEESPSILQEGHAQEPSTSSLRSVTLPPDDLLAVLPIRSNDDNQLQFEIIDTADVDLHLGHRNQSQSLPVAQPTRAELPPPASPPHTPEPTPRAQSRSRAHNAAVTTPRRPRRARVLQASPPSQRRSQLMSITERFLRLEERRLELDHRGVELMEQAAERERLCAQANIALGEGLKALAEAIQNRP